MIGPRVEKCGPTRSSVAKNLVAETNSQNKRNLAEAFRTGTLCRRRPGFRLNLRYVTGVGVLAFLFPLSITVPRVLPCNGARFGLGMNVAQFPSRKPTGACRCVSNREAQCTPKVPRVDFVTRTYFACVRRYRNLTL